VYQFVCELDYKMRAKGIPPAPVISHWIGLDWITIMVKHTPTSESKGDDATKRGIFTNYSLTQ